MTDPTDRDVIEAAHDLFTETPRTAPSEEEEPVEDTEEDSLREAVVEASEELF